MATWFYTDPTWAQTGPTTIDDLKAMYARGDLRVSCKQTPETTSTSYEPVLATCPCTVWHAAPYPDTSPSHTMLCPTHKPPTLRPQK